MIYNTYRFIGAQLLVPCCFNRLSESTQNVMDRLAYDGAAAAAASGSVLRNKLHLNMLIANSECEF